MSQDKLQEAKRVYRNYNRKLDRLNTKIQNGDDDAALKLIEVMTEQELKLRQLGYMIGGKDGKPKIVPFCPRKLNEDLELSKIRKAARDGDMAAIRQFILLTEQE